MKAHCWHGRRAIAPCPPRARSQLSTLWRTRRRPGQKLQRCNGAPQPPIKTQILYTTIHFADPGFEPESGPKQGCLSWERIFCNEGFEIYTNGNAKASAAEITRHCEATWMIWLRTA